MKRSLLLLTLLVGFLGLFRPTEAQAQSGERMLLYTKSGKVIPYRVQHLDSIKFLTDKVDLALHLQIAPHPNGATGAMKLTIGAVGQNVRRISFVLPEAHQVAKMDEYQCLQLFDPEEAARARLQILEAEGNKQYDLPSMQRGYSYTALFLPYDELGCPGDVTRVQFTVPLGSLKGEPSMQVPFSDVKANGFKAKLIPNGDVKGYFYLCEETNNPARDQKMQELGIPDLKHYVVQFGVDPETGKPYEGVKEKTFSELKKNVEYTLYVVLIDAEGQYSDLYDTFKVITKPKGTSETASCTIEVTEITEQTATITTTPDVNTSSFREAIFPKGAKTEEEMLAYLRDTPETALLPFHTEKRTWVWEELEPATTYIAIALAKNADDKWGPLVQKEFTTKALQTEPKLPLEYVAEYNLNEEGNNFVSTQATDVSGYFTYQEAIEKANKVTIAGANYHLPTQAEWMSIIPLDKSPVDYINFAVAYDQKDISETVSVAGKEVTSTNDYHAAGDGIVYALRYKGTELVSAWRYELVPNDGHRVLKITARPLATPLTITVEDIAKDSFWTGEKEVVRQFPASGMVTSSGSVVFRGSEGYFWSATDNGTFYAWGMFFGDSSSDVGRYMSKLKNSVRLFVDAE